MAWLGDYAGGDGGKAHSTAAFFNFFLFFLRRFALKQRFILMEHMLLKGLKNSSAGPVRLRSVNVILFMKG